MVLQIHDVRNRIPRTSEVSNILKFSFYRFQTHNFTLYIRIKVIINLKLVFSISIVFALNQVISTILKQMKCSIT